MPFDDQLPTFDLHPTNLALTQRQAAQRFLMTDPTERARLYREAMLGNPISWNTEMVGALDQCFESSATTNIETQTVDLNDIKISMILHLIYPDKCKGFGIHYDQPTIRDGLLLCYHNPNLPSPKLDSYKYALDVPLTNSNGSIKLNMIPLSILMSDLPEECEPDNIQNYIHQELPTSKFIYNTLRSIKLTPERLFRSFTVYAKHFNVTFPGGDVVGYVMRHLTTTIVVDNNIGFIQKPIWLSAGADSSHHVEFTLNDILNNDVYISKVINNIYYHMHTSWFDEGEVINVNGADIYIHRHNLLKHVPANLDLTKPPADQFADVALKLATEEYNSDDNARYHEKFASYLAPVEGSHRQLRLGTDLKAEGRVMRHCIGGYDGRISDNSSLFFHLDVPGVPYGGTLEMVRYKPSTDASLQYEVWMVPNNDRLEWWTVSQFFGQCNLELKNHSTGRQALTDFLNNNMVRIALQALHLVKQNSSIAKLMKTPSCYPVRRTLFDALGAWHHEHYDANANRDNVSDIIDPDMLKQILAATTNYSWNPNDSGTKLVKVKEPEHEHNASMLTGIDQTLEQLNKIAESKMSIQQLAHQAFLKRQRKFL